MLEDIVLAEIANELPLAAPSSSRERGLSPAYAKGHQPEKEGKQRRQKAFNTI